MKVLRYLLGGLLLATLAGCGPTQVADGGIGGSGITMGRVTGFGSIFVNGMEFDTSNSQVFVDGVAQANDAPIQLGMVVRIDGAYQGASGQAGTIEYRSAVDGVVTGVNLDANGIGSLDVLGQTVMVGPTTIFANGNLGNQTITGLKPLDLIEVSGFSDGRGEIFATRVELQAHGWSNGNATLEIEGVASHLAAPRFEIGGLTVDYSAASSLPPGALDNRYVRVAGTAYDPPSQTLLADRVELVDGGQTSIAADTEHVELEGVVTETYDATSGEFRLNGQRVRISETTGLEGTTGDILPGREMRLEGVMNGALLEASEIHLAATQEQVQEMAGVLEAAPDLGSQSLQLMGQTVMVDSSTIMQDEEQEERYFSLADLQAGSAVEVKVYQGASDLVAVKIERKSHSQFEVDGTVQALDVDGDPRLIRVLNITVDISRLQLNPSVGQRVEIKGSYANGILSAIPGERDDD